MSANSDSQVLNTLAIVMGALVAFAIIVMFAANILTDDLDEKAKAGNKMHQAVVAERIKPAGEVNVASANAAPAAPKSGDEVYTASCASCHGTGALGAPKSGDKAAWNARMSNGIDGLTTNAVNGIGAMPPKGGAAALSDDEVRAAIEHMLKESGIEAGSASASAPAETAATTPVGAAANMMSNVMGAAADTANAVATAVAGHDLDKGKDLYTKACVACHSTGVAGAPVTGNKAAWTQRIAQGVAVLNDHAINGFRGMPPKGGAMSLSNSDVEAIVAYMIAESK